jgi:ABC-2 type transport system permease protein
MDTFLAMPVSRSRLLTERFASLFVPIGIVNIVTPPVVVGGGWLIGEQLAVVDIAAVHLFSVAYLFACAGIGILCSVIFDRVSVAQRVALAVTFFLFVMESLVEGTDFEPVGSVTPMRYFSPNEILLDSTYNIVGLGVLVVMTVGLVVLSTVIFARKDV